MLENFTEEERAAAIRAAQDTCWRSGDLSFLLDECQLEFYESVAQTRSKYFVIECARRLGKSFFLAVLAVEQALRKPKSNILYAAITATDAREFISPLLAQICETAPFRIKFDRQQCKFVFPNGSQIRVFGCDNVTKANKIRGTNAHLVLVDEAGFIPELNYVLQSVVNPTTQTTKGRVIIASSPSPIPDHPFTLIAENAERGGNYVRKTIFDNPRISDEDREKYVKDDADLVGMTVEEFKKSDVYKREHLALRVIDTNLVVIPEWHEQYELVERPQFYDGYMSIDFGGVDPHAILFGYWDFEASCLVIEDELLLRDGENTAEIAEQIKVKETELWGTKSWDGTLRGARERENLPEWLMKSVLATGNVQPYMRTCDTDIHFARDLAQLHQLSVIPTQKDHKQLQVNAVRIMFREKRIKVHPRCRNLGRMLRQTMWLNENQRDYRRKNGEHGDLVDCLVYMVRNLRKSRDPRPAGYGTPVEDVWVKPKPKQASLFPSWVDQM